MCADDKSPIYFYGRIHPEWAFLSNFYPSPIVIANHRYATTEHYYQAMKTVKLTEREIIRCAKTPAEAEKLGGMVRLRPRWESHFRLTVMRHGLRAKFTQHPDLMEKLLATGHRPLREDSPKDDFWGWYGGKGVNKLGILLEETREFCRRREGRT